MSFDATVQRYIEDMRARGRINSMNTERAYRSKLMAHGDDIRSGDPVTATARDVKRTLKRYGAETSRRQSRAILASFYGWMVDNGLRSDSPVAEGSWATAVPTRQVDLALTDARALLDFSLEDPRDERIVHLALCAGLRVSEIAVIGGQHFRKQRGWLWIPPDVGKYGERYVPLTADLAPVAVRSRKAAPLGLSYAGLHKRVRVLGSRAGVPGVTPIAMRKAFAQQMLAFGANNAASMLGNSRAAGRVDDETAAKVREFTYWS